MPSSASLQSGVLLVPQEAHSFSTLIGTTPKSSSQLGDELNEGESPLSSLQNGSGVLDHELLLELNKRTGVLQFLRRPVRRVGSLVSEHGCDLGRLLEDDDDIEKTESTKTSGVNSSRLTDLFIPDLTVNMTPFIDGSDFVALFNGRRGFLGVTLPVGDWRGV